MKKTLSLRKQALLAPKFVLVTNQYGSDMFISDMEKTNIPVTDTISEALEFSVGFDNPEIKLGYWKAKTGYNLQVRFETKCEAAGCNCNSNFMVQRNWGAVDTIGFCKNHAPEWLKASEIGANSPEENMIGITKSWYKRIA